MVEIASDVQGVILQNFRGAAGMPSESLIPINT